MAPQGLIKRLRHDPLAAIASFAFFINFKPSEAWLTPFLLDFKGISEQQLYDIVYPAWTYAYAVSICIVAPLVTSVGPWACLALGLAARLIVRTLLVAATGLAAMVAVEIFFGFACAAEVIVLSVAFSHITSYSAASTGRAASLSRAAPLAAHLVSSLLGQLLVALGAPLPVLFALSLCFVALGVPLLFFIPRDHAHPIPFRQQVGVLCDCLRDASAHALAPLIAYCVASAAHGLALNFATALLEDVRPQDSSLGFSVAVARGSGALGALDPLHLGTKFHSRVALAGAFFSLGAIAAASMALSLPFHALWLASSAYSLYYFAAEAGLALCAALLVSLTRAGLAQTEPASLFAAAGIVCALSQAGLQALIVAYQACLPLPFGSSSFLIFISVAAVFLLSVAPLWRNKR
jgi:hypothetical protein